MKQLIVTILVLVTFFTSVSANEIVKLAGKGVKSALTPIGYNEPVALTRSTSIGYSKEEILSHNLEKIDSFRKAAVGVAVEAASVPVVVSTASSLGVTASTGTAIGTLSGAAATSATLAAIGSSTVGTSLGGAAAVVGIAAGPAVVGGVIIVGVAAGIAMGVNALIDLW